MPKGLSETCFSALSRMAHVSRGAELGPSGERFLGDLPDGEDLELPRKAAQERRERRAAVGDFGEAGLAIAGRPAGTARFRPGLRRLAVRMPRKCVPEDHLEGRARPLDLAPDHRGAALALRLRGRAGARHFERAMCDEAGLVQHLRLGAERDAGETAAAMARRLAEKEEPRRAMPR